MDKQQSEAKQTMLRHRVLSRKQKWFVGIATMTLVAGLATTTVFDLKQHTTLKKDITVTPALVTAKQNSSAQALLVNNYAQLPLQFEQNRGQVNDAVAYLSRGAGYTLYITATETLLSLQSTDDKNPEATVVRTSFVNANVPTTYIGDTTLPGKVNYLIGQDKNDWITDIPTYRDVLAKGIYPGIDVRYHGDQRQLEYDFIVAPGVASDVIQIKFDGINDLSLNETGDLILITAQGEIKHKKPIVYQDINGERVTVEGSYLIADNSNVRFNIGTYDPHHELIIDPILDYSTYLGGNKRDEGIAVAVDGEGNAYVIGTTKSKDDFPVVNPIQAMRDNKEDVFISKLNADGTSLIYSTYLGGRKDDVGKDIAVDTNGHAYIIGDTESKDDFPLANPYQSDHGGKTDAFIAKLSIDGSALVFSTFFGGDDDDEGEGIAVDAQGNVIFTGETESKQNEGFPLLNALQPQFGGDDDAYVAKLSGDGSTLLFSTYFGGDKDEESEAIALDSNGDIYITGETESKEHQGFPILNAAQAWHGGKDDAFVAKISSDGSTLVYSTYLGGDKDDEAEGIAVTANGEAVVTGETESKENDDFPLVNALQAEHGGKDDAFVTKLSASGNNFLYSTYLGGNKDDEGEDIAVDSQGNAYIVGTTESNDFPIADAIQATREGKDDVFITKISDDGSTLIFSSYFGGKKDDIGEGIAVDDNGNAYIVGITKSKNDFPLENAVQALFGGGDKDAFIAKIASDNQAPEITSDPILTGIANQLYTYTVEAIDADGDTLIFSLNQFPAGMTIDEDTGEISWLADVTGDTIIEVEVDDSNGGTDTQTYTLTITADNQAPVITSSPVTTALTNQSYTYDVNATDVDNDTLSYSLQIFPAGMAIDSVTGVINWTPDTVGDFNVTVLVDDSNGGSDTQTFVITVLDPDVTAPTIIISSPQDGLVTNQTNQIITGTLDEAAALTVNGNPVTVNPDLSFSIAVTLVEGSNVFTLEATDTATNVGTATLILNLDTVVTVITVTSPQDGLITNQATQTITGDLSEAASLTLNGQAVTINPDLSFSTEVTLVEGDNVYAFIATEVSGNQTTESITLTLDTAAPVVTITEPVDGSLTNVVDQTFTGNVNEAVSLTFNTVNVPVNPDNSFSIGPVALTEGNNTFSVVATDLAGNDSTQTVSVTLDTIAPTITVIAPVDNSITNQASQTINGTVDETGVLTINGNAVAINPDNTFSLAVTLIEGENSFTLDIADAATNQNTQSLTVILDTAAPVITIATPADGLLTNQANQTISGTLNETATLTINGQTVTVNPDNSYSFPVTLVEGSNAFNLEATDLAANTTAQTITLNLDSIVPVVSITNPANGLLTNNTQQFVTGNVSESAALTINGQAVTLAPDNSFSFGPLTLSEGSNLITVSATDAATNNGNASVSVSLDTVAPIISVTSPVNNTLTNQNQITVTGQVSELATLSINGQAVQVELDGSFNGTINLTEGTNTLTLTASDAATNVGQTSITVTSDTTAPIVSVTNPVDGSTTNQANQSISGTLNEAATLTINGQIVTVNPDLTFSAAATLVEGTNTITFQATDTANNVAAGSVTVTLDNTPPVVIVITPADNTQTNQSDVLFSGTINEAASITINGVVVTVNPDNTYSQTITLSDGNNAVPVVVTDSVGNSSTTIVNVIVDATPPTINIGQINRGNPQGGVVMIVGQAGAVEAGALIHIINPTTNYEARVLAESDGSFSTDVAGFANDTFEIFAVDAAGNQSATLSLIPNPPLALTLDTIGDQTAPLGQVTRFTVTANDSEGEPITLGLTPVPLPAGMEYNITTGEVTFRPTAEQVGTFALNFSAESEDERVNETINVTVPAIDPAAPTEFIGRVLDTNGFTEGTLIPIVGATVTFLGSGVTTTTDIDGYFTLSGLPSDAVLFDIDASTASPAPGGASYASFREGLIMVQNVVNQEERPFFLPRIDADSVTQVNPTQTTVVNNPNLRITMTVPPNTAKNADGTPFVGELSISQVPLSLAPVALPDTFQPSLLITVQPVGVSYTTPVPITYPNIDNLAPDTEVDLYQVDRDLGVFVVIGTGLVSADGQRIETISGGVTANTWGAPAPAAPVEPRPVDPEEDDPDDPPCNCNTGDGGSTIGLNDGRMGTNFSLPAYRSLEASRALTFKYQSSRAFSKPVLPFNIGLRSGRTAIPSTISYKLTVSGLQQGKEVFISGAGLGSGSVARSGFAFDGDDFTSGQYTYDLVVSNNFSRTSIGSSYNGIITVENEEASVFGAGWLLEGLYRLAFNPDGSITRIAPAGHMTTYRPNGIPDQFDSPDSDYAVFIRNPDGSYNHTEKDGVKMHFDASGLITEHEDRNNNITGYTYDTEDKLITITDPVGLETILTYDNNGLIATITDPANRVTAFEHDAVGNLTKAIFPDNTFEEFEYNDPDSHLITARFDERRNRYTYNYDNFGRIIDSTLPDGTVRAAANQTSKGLIDVESGEGTAANPAPAVMGGDVDADYVDGRGNPSSKLIDPHGRTLMQVDEIGRVTDHVRDADSNPTQTTRPIGSVVTRTFDNFGNVLTQKEEFNTATTTYTYDPFSLVTSVTNPRNHTTTINRDPVDGNPLTIVNELGHTTTMVYDSRGLVTKMTSPNGLVTDYTYNNEGLMDTKTETPPVGSPGNVRDWTYSYFPTGLLETVNTPDGITLNYTYDDRSFLTTVTDNLNQSIVYTYDDHKNVIKTETTNSDGSLALLVDSIYDNRNRLKETRAPHVGVEESITQRILDNNSNLIALIDPNGNSSNNSYDPFNRLDTNTHREGGVTDYTYDAQDRIIKVEAPNGVETDYEYDIISRRTKEISQDRGTISYTYDLANNVDTITEGRGIVATMAYDELERVSTKTYPNTIIGKNENVAYTYDTCSFGLGFLCTRADESGNYAYNYDAYGNMTNSIFTESAGTVYNMSYLYDDGDHVIQSTYPSGRVVDYARDGVRRVDAIDTTLNGVAQNIVSGISYRGDNQITQCTFGNGLIDERSYDLQGRLTNQLLRDALNTLIDDRTYTYDKNSNVLNIATNVEDNAYLYDKLDRLTSDTIDNNTPFDFTYDLNDNRLTKNLQDLTLQEFFEQQTGSNRLTVLESVQAGLTPIENATNRDLVYNDVGRLYQLIEEGTLKAEYFYNDAGQRTRKTNYQGDGITVDSITIYHYDSMGYLITETNETGVLIKDYIWQEGMVPVAQIDNNAGTEDIVYLYTDHLMTNRLATDDTQSVVWRWEGEAFGNTPAQELASTSVNLRFPGQYFDAETNLHYNHNRYYDPTLGRYITSDPIGISGGLNSYSYGLQNSVRHIDPLGLETTMVCRPLHNPIASAIGMVHCSVFVWHWETDDNCNEIKVIDSQYSVAGGQSPLEPSTNPNGTYNSDRESFNNPGGDNQHHDIPPPDGMTQSDFDAAVQNAGDNYNSGVPYDSKWGPNSNTASDNIIEGAGGAAPSVPGAWQQNHGEGIMPSSSMSPL